MVDAMSAKWFCACFVAWLLAALAWNVPHITEHAFFTLSIFCAVAGVIAFCFQFKAHATVTWFGWVCVSTAVGLYASYAVVHRAAVIQRIMQTNSSSAIQGVIITDVSAASFGGYQFDMRFKKICSADQTYCRQLPMTFRARITVSVKGDLVHGSTVTVAGILAKPKPSPLGDNGTTFADYLSAKGICCTIQSGNITDAIAPHGTARFRNNARMLFWNTYHRYVGSPNDGIAAGIVYGEKNHITDALANDFRIAGLSHIMVLSGSNVTIMLLILFPLLAIIRSRFIRFAATTLLFISILFFLGVDPPLVRAVVMASLAYMIKERGNPAHAFRALVISAMIMGSLNPPIILYDVSFHLSFLATLGLVCAGDYFLDKMKKIPERFDLRETLAITLAVSLFVYPYSMYQFGTLSMFGLLANVLVIPLVPIVMGLGAALVPAAAISNGLGVVVAMPFKIAVGYVVGVAHWVSTLPFASVHAALSLTSMFALYGLLLVLFRKAIV